MAREAETDGKSRGDGGAETNIRASGVIQDHDKRPQLPAARHSAGQTAGQENRDTEPVSRMRDAAGPWRAFLNARSVGGPSAPARRTGAGWGQALLPDRIARDRLWQAQGLLGCAFAFALGILGYRLLPEEPDWRVLAAIAVLCCGLALRRIRTGLTPLMLFMICMFAGLTAATVRTALVEAPRLAEPVTVQIEGTVVEVQERRSGTRLVLDVTAINGRMATAGRDLSRVRLRIPDHADLLPGDRVSARARLFPPMGPVVPGGYDFAFGAFFEGIGASGYSYGVPELVPGPPPGFFRLMARKVDQLRRRLANRIVSVLGESPETALAVALLVGDRSRIDEPTEESLRAAGLAHILAISGLHMALFAGGAYAACLGGLAAVPRLALRWPLHKMAAVLALSAATFYLVLSGASVATQRSYLMIALVFLGILTGRRGLTLRSVALAGLVLLILAPERLFSPGFQMSFAAVIALIAVYDVWRGHRAAKGYGRRPAAVSARALQTLASWVAGLLVTALVAGLATGIIGAHHFSRIAPFGVIGNLIGMPVFSILVMPMGVLSLVLMPFGLAALPLQVMSCGLGILLQAASFTQTLAPETGRIATLSAPAAFLLMAGLFSGLLLPGRLRTLSLLPVLAGVSVAILSRPPDIQIPASGTQIAARDQTGTLRLASARASFAAETWLETEGEAVTALNTRKMTKDQRRCDPHGCVIHAYARGGGASAQSPLAIAMPANPDALLQDCQKADIIVSDKIAPKGCRAIFVADRALRGTTGALSIWLGQARTAQSSPPEQRPRAPSQTEPAAKTDPAVQPERVQAVKPRIIRIVYALSRPPRPWHQPGTVTRATLRAKK